MSKEFTLDTAGLNQTNVTLNQSYAVGPSQGAMYTGAVIMLVSLIFEICGNILVMIVIIGRKYIANIIYIFVVSICIDNIINIG